jgi:hypothetical protein
MKIKKQAGKVLSNILISNGKLITLFLTELQQICEIA